MNYTYTSTSCRKFSFDNISENDFETAPIAAINTPIKELIIIYFIYNFLKFTT